jgi:ABC-2 type transport system ATP-binding protein
MTADRATAVSVRGVTKAFGDHVVLDDVTLDIAAGSVYGLLGPNGAGKTTLIRILTTLLPPTSGSATIDGADVVAAPKRVRELIGLAGQFAAVDGHLTGRENLEMVGRLYRLGRREARRRADTVLERIHLADAGDQLVRTYSGGMRRRLDLAASLVGRPSVLFLDEPTTGVDPRSRIDIWDLVAEMVGDGTTLLLTTQYLEEAERVADRIGVIDLGRLVAEGTADELKGAFGGDRIEVTVEPERLADAGDALREALGHVTVDPRRGVLLVAAPHGPHDLRTALDLLQVAGVDPIDIGLRRPSLDEVFLALTDDRGPAADPPTSATSASQPDLAGAPT